MSKGQTTIDPTATANAQTQSNIQTAQAQAALNAPLGNISNIYGSNQVLTNSQGLPEGQISTMAPWEQGLLGQQAGNAGAINNAAGSLASNLPTGGLNMNFGDTVNNAANAAYGAQTNYLNPQFALQNKDLETQLDSRGLPIGSEARTDAENNQQNQQNLAYTQAANNAYGTGLAAQQQGYTQAVGQSMLPYQQLGLLTGANPTSSLLGQAPGAANLSSSSVQPTNVAGIDQTAAQLAQAQNAQYASGALGIGTLGLLALSDKDAKEDIKPIGKTFDGQTIHRYRYKGDPARTPRLGLIAQEVEKKHPEAVSTGPGGFKMVDYGAATQRAASLGLGNRARPQTALGLRRAA